MEGQAEAPRLLDQVRHVLRLHHYSIHTERSYNAVRAERKVNVPVVLTRLAFPDAHLVFLVLAGQVKPNRSCSTQPRVRPVRIRR